jgi:hypothetical protein
VFVKKWWIGRDRGSVKFRRSFGSEFELGVLLTLGVEEEEEEREKMGTFIQGFQKGSVVFVGGGYLRNAR